MVMVRILEEVPESLKVNSHIVVTLKFINHINDEDYDLKSVSESVMYGSDNGIIYMSDSTSILDMTTVLVASENISEDLFGMAIDKGVYLSMQQNFIDGEWSTDWYVSACEFPNTSFAKENITNSLGYIPANASYLTNIEEEIIGDLLKLKTNTKTSIVDAINEIYDLLNL